MKQISLTHCNCFSKSLRTSKFFLDMFVKHYDFHETREVKDGLYFRENFNYIF